MVEFFGKDVLQLVRRSQQYLWWPLLLRRFIERTKAWAHFDIYAWNPAARSHGPEGGEVQAARALFELVGERFGAAMGS